MAHFRSFEQRHPMNFFTISLSHFHYFSIPTDKDQEALGLQPMTYPSSNLLGTMLLKCCMRTSDVGGIPSSGQPFLANTSFLHSLTVDIVLVQSYSSTTNHSIDSV